MPLGWQRRRVMAFGNKIYFIVLGMVAQLLIFGDVGADELRPRDKATEVSAPALLSVRRSGKQIFRYRQFPGYKIWWAQLAAAMPARVVHDKDIRGNSRRIVQGNSLITARRGMKRLGAIKEVLHQFSTCEGR